MNENRLSEIKARCDAATPGLWECAINCPIPGYALDDEHIQIWKPFYDPPNVRDDAKFIAHARQDIPDLLAEIERLKSELAAVTDDRNHGQRVAAEEIERLRSANARMDAALAELANPNNYDVITDEDGNPTDYFVWTGTNCEMAIHPWDFAQQAWEQNGCAIICVWKYDAWDDCWQTGCNNEFVMTDGTPSENGVSYCPYCGGSLQEAEYEQEENEDEP